MSIVRSASFRQLEELWIKATDADPVSTRHRTKVLTERSFLPDMRNPKNVLTPELLAFWLIAKLASDVHIEAGDVAHSRLALKRRNISGDVFETDRTLASDVAFLIKHSRLHPSKQRWICAYVECGDGKHNSAKIGLFDLETQRPIVIDYGDKVITKPDEPKPVQTRRLLEGSVLAEVAKLATI